MLIYTVEIWLVIFILIKLLPKMSITVQCRAHTGTSSSSLYQFLFRGTDWVLNVCIVRRKPSTSRNTAGTAGLTQKRPAERQKQTTRMFNVLFKLLNPFHEDGYIRPSVDPIQNTVEHVRYYGHIIIFIVDAVINQLHNLPDINLTHWHDFDCVNDLVWQFESIFHSASLTWRCNLLPSCIFVIFITRAEVLSEMHWPHYKIGFSNRGVIVLLSSAETQVKSLRHGDHCNVVSLRQEWP